MHKPFASYLWCVAYSLTVLYDEAVAKPAQNLYLSKALNEIDKKRISDAQAVFDYGISLIRAFSAWDNVSVPYFGTVSD